MTPAGPIPPPRRRRRGGLIIGGVTLFVLGALGAPTLLVVAVLTANPCGAFGDHCASYGQTSTVAVVAFSGAAVAAVVAVLGLVLTIVGAVSHRR